jgi:hypothetical protein
MPIKRRVGREGSKGRYVLVGDEGEGATSQHFSGEVSEDWACLCMQVAQHFVRAPTTEKLDDVGVDTTTEECICTCGTKTSGSDITGEKSQGWSNKTDCEADGIRDGSWPDRFGSTSVDVGTR